MGTEEWGRQTPAILPANNRCREATAAADARMSDRHSWKLLHAKLIFACNFKILLVDCSKQIASIASSSSSISKNPHSTPSV